MVTVSQKKILLKREEDTARLGTLVAEQLSKPMEKAIFVYLLGDLGVGKTTLTRFIARGLGYEGVVKSPTYTLVEAYEMPSKNLYHFDLYRLSDPAELEYLGVEDYFASSRSVCVVEWPEKAAGYLPAADLILRLDYVAHETIEGLGQSDEAREVEIDIQNANLQNLTQSLSVGSP